MMDFLSFTEFQHYVTGVYVIVSIGVIGLTAYILITSQKQHSRLKKLENQTKKAVNDAK